MMLLLLLLMLMLLLLMVTMSWLCRWIWGYNQIHHRVLPMRHPMVLSVSCTGQADEMRQVSDESSRGGG